MLPRIAVQNLVVDNESKEQGAGGIHVAGVELICRDGGRRRVCQYCVSMAKGQCGAEISEAGLRQEREKLREQRRCCMKVATKIVQEMGLQRRKGERTSADAG